MSDFIDPKALAGNFPFIPRGNQAWVLEMVNQLLAKPEIKNIILEAPTGSGKSAIAVAVGRSVQNAFVFTSNKALQDQYLGDFSRFISDLRGRVNYECCSIYEDPKKKGKWIKKKSSCGPGNRCGYHQALDTATTASIVSMNYAAGLCFLNYTPFFPSRKVLICDEAHNLESMLTGFVGIELSEDLLKETYPILYSKERIPEFVTAYEYLPWLELISSRAEEANNNNSALKENEDFQFLMGKISDALTAIEMDSNNFVVVHEDRSPHTQRIKKVHFKPIDVSRYAKGKIFQHATVSVFLSATIGSPDGFCKNLGLKPEETAYIQVPSTFPKENRPIVRDYVGYLSRHNLIESIPRIVEKILGIGAFHSNEKGVIFCPSYSLCIAIYEALPASFRSRVIFPRTAQDKAASIAKHAASTEPTILLSPSMSEGVDLKDDLSRFAILCKIPYPNVGDPIVEARMKRDKKWSDREVIKTIAQSYGRSIRTETDYATFYILDQCFERLLQNNRGEISEYMMEALDPVIRR
jgi:ATP-dependent DNA helicase DinG